MKFPTEHFGGGTVRFVDDSKASIQSLVADNTEHTWTATEDCWITGICYRDGNAGSTASNFTVGGKRVAYIDVVGATQGFFVPVKKEQIVKWKNSGFNGSAYPMLSE